ncbi:disease resistance protein RUN1-like isoform X1 [Carya illinoinensis]|uniref:disease resistance protein RUN1-like isoform X1 n=1 Tax=Carya illinoinensis TaxID=32201 RepID=UPI001C7209BD|nr:disease resistance protein RUN1-like isoform X1 [Carya illinoinensis]
MSTSSMAFQLGASSSLSFSSSSSIRRWTHDVFLSSRGTDVRKYFISHLYHALYRRGVNTYIDNNLEKGEEISSELLKAIDGSKISIVVLSKNYSDSRWCLDELLKILECKAMVKQNVLPLFYDVNPSDVRRQKGSFGKAFARLRFAINDEVKVTMWEAALKKVGSLAGVVLGDRNESDFILDIITWVDSIMINRTSLNVAKYPVGIKSRVRDIYQRLSLERNDITCMVGIWGTGGIGKTTISKEIYNRIFHQFEGSCFLKNIRESSKTGGLIRLQNTLLYEILGENLDVRDCDRGINVISHRLHSKRVLLILDDVDELKQLETLAGDRKWFGPGSRIIVTTRDQDLLNIFKVDSTYQMEILAYSEARKLVSLHAFEKEEPLDSYAEVFEQVMQYARGLPLALTVLGSNLKGKTICQWESALDKYKQIPNENIQSVLQVSYDGLEECDKDMFLDIACFFKGQPLADVIKIFESCNFHPNDGIPKLIDKCLITVGYDIWMHDLLQDMGREIVRKESPKEPGARSRLWCHEDIRYVLEENTGTNNVEGIKVDLPVGHDHDTICLSPNAFKEMKRLRIFISHNAHFSGEFNYLSNELRVLNWSNYHLQSLPSNFRGEKLVVFKMHAGCIKEIITGKFKNLTKMKFSKCKFLTRIPDFSSCSNLEELSILTCENLVEIHDSVGFLNKLVSLGLYGCPNLRSFPRRLKLRSLRYLALYDCSELQNFPQIECKMEFLSSIHLEGTPIKELPSSIIGYLTPAINSLSLKRCTSRLQNRNELCLGDYSIKLEEDEPDSSVNGCFTGIDHLSIEGSLVHLLISIPHLQHLKSLSLANHPNIAIDEIHSSIGYLTRLKKLHLTTSPLVDGFWPSVFNNWYLDDFSDYCSSTLQELDLSESSAIVSLPPSIKSFVEWVLYQP